MHLFSDSTKAVTIFQAGKGRDQFIQACTREIWLMFAGHEIILRFSHTLRMALEESADALSYWYMGQLFKDCVRKLIKDRGLTIISVKNDFFNVSPLL